MDLGQAFYFSIKNQCVFVFMLMTDACLKQWIPCIIHISIFGAVLAGKSAYYTRVNTVPTFQRLHVLYSQSKDSEFIKLA